MILFNYLKGENNSMLPLKTGVAGMPAAQK
jgi:hypothetical protein